MTQVTQAFVFVFVWLLGWLVEDGFFLLVLVKENAQRRKNGKYVSMQEKKELMLLFRFNSSILCPFLQDLHMRERFIRISGFFLPPFLRSDHPTKRTFSLFP